MSDLHKLKQMVSEPASKEWFAKHGTPKHSALNKKKGGHTDEKGIYHKTLAEQKETTKHWPRAKKGESTMGEAIGSLQAKHSQKRYLGGGRD